MMADVKEQVSNVALALTQRGLKFETVDGYERPVIDLSFGGGDFSFSHITLHVIFDLDGDSVQVSSSPIANVPADKTDKLLSIVNACNRNFRWVKFHLDPDGDLVASADAIISAHNAGGECIEIVMRAANIIDDAYADIMKGIWG